MRIKDAVYVLSEEWLDLGADEIKSEDFLEVMKTEEKVVVFPQKTEVDQMLGSFVQIQPFMLKVDSKNTSVPVGEKLTTEAKSVETKTALIRY